MSDDEEPLRADARANRDKLLEVAKEVLAADPGAALNAIAKQAGVGQGTLYRHFPTREALFLAVYRHEIDALVGLAPRLLAAHPPLQAFRLWVDRLVQAGRVKHGVGDLVRSALTDKEAHELYLPMAAAVRQLLVACEAAGELRPGTEPDDALALLSVLWRLPPHTSGKAQSDRIVEMIFRGLGVGAAKAPPKRTRRSR